MKVTQEKLPASQIGIEIELPADMTKKAYESTIGKLKNTVRIPGFRPGKVPRPILIQRLGVERIKAAALEELIDDGLKQALKQESIEALGNYQLKSPIEELLGQYKPGEPLTFSVAVDVEPEVTLSEYKGLTITAEEIAYDPQRVEDFLEARRDEYASLVPVEGRPAEAGDTATVDYVGYFTPEEGAEPQEIPGAQVEDFQLELVEGRLIPGIIEGIIGMNPEETKEIAVTFPVDYANEMLAGKPATFTVTLRDLKGKELPELDDDLAQEVSEFETLGELRESLEERYRKEAEEKTTANQEVAVLQELTVRVEVDLPETLISQELDGLVAQALMRLENYGVDVKPLLNEESVAGLREEMRPQAIARLKQTLALKEIARLESLEPATVDVERRMEEILDELRDRNNVDAKKLRDYAAKELREKSVLEWLRQNNTLEMVPEGTLKNEDEGEPELRELSEEEMAAIAEGEPPETIEVEAIASESPAIAEPESLESESLEPEASETIVSEPEAESELNPTVESDDGDMEVDASSPEGDENR